MTNKISLLLALIVTSITFFSSCENEENTIGREVLPNTDSFELFADSSEVITTKVIQSDSSKTFNNTKNFLGAYYDDTFGKVKASLASYATGSIDTSFVKYINNDFNIKMVLKANNDSILRAMFADTVRLSSPNQKFTVYTIKGELPSSDTTYSSRFDLTPYIGDEVGSKEFKFYSTDKSISIDLDGLETIMKNNSSNYSSAKTVDKFEDKVSKGFIIKSDFVDINGGGLVYFNMDSCYVNVDYKFGTGSSQKDTAFKVKFKTSKSINTIERDYTGTKVKAALDETFDKTKEQKLYVQNIEGLRTLIQFPEINHLIDSSFVIQKAILSVGYDEDYYNTGQIHIPTRLSLLPLRDSKPIYTSAFNGYRTTSGRYEFNITQYVINVLQGTIDNHGLYFMSTSAVQSNSSTVAEDITKFENFALRGVDPNNSYKSLKLKIEYSKYKK